MKPSTGRLLQVTALILALAGISGTVLAQDNEAVVKNREALMKGQGKDLGSVKAFIEGKGDQAAAEAGAANLRRLPPPRPTRSSWS